MRRLSHSIPLCVVMFSAALSTACATGEGATKDDSAAASTAESGMAWKNGRRLSETLYTAGQPNQADLESAKAAGVTTVINLRDPSENGFWAEEQAAVEALGMKYVSVVVAKPVSDPGSINVEQARALSAALESADGLAVVHCASGNRVGAVLAIKAAALDGKSKDEALEYGRKAGMTSPGLEVIVNSRLAGE